MEKRNLFGTYFRTVGVSMMVVSILAAVVIVIMVTRLSTKVDTTYNSAKERMEKNVGKQIVLDGDTLTVTDYSVIKNTYILSGEKEVGAKFVEENK